MQKTRQRRLLLVKLIYILYTYVVVYILKTTGTGFFDMISHKVSQRTTTKLKFSKIENVRNCVNFHVETRQ